MPECYTHLRVATRALMRAGLTVACQPAFVAGANGPDALYFYKGFSKNPKPDLPGLAARMHREHTGAMLAALCRGAITPVQQSYALGFLAHCAADGVLYPYITAMTKRGMPYAGHGGQRCMEAALDSTLYYTDYRSYRVPLDAGTPCLVGEELADVAGLLQETVLQAFGEDVPVLALADTFHDMRRVRRFLISRTGLRKVWVSLFGAHYRDRRGPGNVRERMQPAKPLKELPTNWKHPYTHELQSLGLHDVLAEAEEAGAVYMVAAMSYWLGQIEESQLCAILKDNNCFTGLANPKPGAADHIKITQEIPPVGTAG